MNNKQTKTDLIKLKELYIHTDMTLEEMSKQLGVGYKSIKKWLNRLDLHRTPEHEERVFKKRYEKREQNLLSKYGVTNVAKLDVVKEKQRQHTLEMWQERTPEQKELIANKVAATKLQKYGSTTYNNMEKNKQTKLERYGDENYNNMEKNNATKSKNRSTGKSKEEQFLKQILIKYFGSDNVKEQVKLKETSNLKFDFVVNDLHIELNGEFWHNYRPFDINNPKHLQEYYSLKQKGDNIHKAIAKHWRFDDTRKLKYCQDNNINYIVIYFDTLPLDTILKLILDNKIGQNIITIKDKDITVQRLSKPQL